MNIGNIKIPTNLSLNNSALPHVTFARDLGITITSNLSPSHHIRDIVHKAQSRALAIHRSFVSHDVTLLMRAYKTYVRPLVEHNSVIWSPPAIGDIEDIERVQRKFTKKIKGLQHYPYIERLRRLNLHSLELRRLHTDLIWCYKIYFGLIDVDVNEFFVHSSVLHTRGHRYKLFKKHSTSIRASFFCERVVNVWNKLPDNTDFSSYNAFKRSILNTDFSTFLKRF